MAQTFLQLRDRRDRAVVFEVSDRGLYTDFPNGNVAVARDGSGWVVIPRGGWKTPMRRFASALPAFNYARHCART